MLAIFAERYAGLTQAGHGLGGDFDRDVEAETA
jgi:hypothetical protein